MSKTHGYVPLHGSRLVKIHKRQQPVRNRPVLRSCGDRGDNWISMFVAPPLRLRMVRPAFYCRSAEAPQHTATRPWRDLSSDWSMRHSNHARTPNLCIHEIANTKHLFVWHPKY